MRWGSGRAACMTEKRNAYKTVVGKAEEKSHLESRRIILKCILKTHDVAGPCKHADKPSGYIKFGEIL
jgi:hypothetical protein